MRKFVEETRELFDQYDTFTYASLCDRLKLEIDRLPEDQKSSVRFEIENISYPYDEGVYPYMVMRFKRPETDQEMNVRESQDSLK